MKQSASSKPFKSNLARLRRMPDASIGTGDIPQLNANFFRRAKLRLPSPKVPVCLRLDRDLLSWYKRQGKGYQTRINAILWLYANQHGLRHGAR